MSYHGDERRIHRVMITKNTEYHLRGLLCVAVRKGEHPLNFNHSAVGQKLEGSFGFSSETGFAQGQPGRPENGHRLVFSGDILTSPLTQIQRSSYEDFLNYPAPDATPPGSMLRS